MKPPTSTRLKRFVPALVVFLVVSGLALAQRRFGGGRFSFGEGRQTARQHESGSTGTPVWTNSRGFEKDVFTFARLQYNGFGGRGGGWATDLPDSDLNLSYRLQQMTSLKVDPDGRIVSLTDRELTDFPWLYIVEPGRLDFNELEVMALRKYLLNGGFIWFDDFWGDQAWQNVERQMKRVLPDRSFNELPIEHPLYRSVFNITAKGQVPNYRDGENSKHTGITWEGGSDTRTVHHRAIMDDKGRLMVFATHNSDNGDGWEREGEYEYYFKNFSEKIAYPLAINVVFYVMTH